MKNETLLLGLCAVNIVTYFWSILLYIGIALCFIVLVCSGFTELGFGAIILNELIKLMFVFFTYYFTGAYIKGKGLPAF